ncbi:MAG TPA: DUF971 domain-containing protein [Rhabdochlamydiaceae bacterium]|jgi:DUF971 family protein
MSEGIFIRKIFQRDQYRFTIEWTDGRISHYKLSDVQRQCLCAQCRDEMTGRSLISPALVDEEVGAVEIVNVGRYALKITFTNGCSRGIYSFALLRQLAGF